MGKEETWVAGGFSGLVTRAMLQPLDVLKIRLQVQEEAVSKGGGKYAGFIHAFTLISKEEGIKAFWKGHVPGQCLSIFYGGVQFSAFEYLAGKLTPADIKRSSDLVNFASGMGAASLAMTFTEPFDILRTRFIAQNENHKVYKTMPEAVVRMVKEEGPMSLWKGWTPAVVTVALHAGFNFMVKKRIYNVWDDAFPANENPNSLFSFYRHFVCGFISGGSAKTLTYPCDVIKKRLQVRGFEAGRVGQGATTAVAGAVATGRSILAKEGARGFYKGLVPATLKTASASALSFFFYEWALAAYRVWGA